MIWLGQEDFTTGSRNRRLQPGAVFVQQGPAPPKKGKVAEPGLRSAAPGSRVIMWAPVSVPPGIGDDGATLVADHAVFPPGLRVDRLPTVPSRGAGWNGRAGNRLIAHRHQGADRHVGAVKVLTWCACPPLPAAAGIG